MGMRDWLIIIVIIGIILILLDGYRRKRKDSIRVQIDKNIPPVDDDIIEAAELPNGGARVIPRDNDFDDDEEYEEYEEYEDDDDYQDHDDHDDEDKIVPVLMDAVEIDKDLPLKELSVNEEESEQENSKSDEYNSLDSDEGWEEDDDEEEDEDEDEDVEGNEDDSDNDDEDDELEEFIEESHLSGTKINDSDDSEINDDDCAEEYGDAGYENDETNEADSFDDEDISPVRVKKREEELSLNPASKIESQVSKGAADRIEPTLGEMESFSEDELDDGPARGASSQSKKQEKKQKQKKKSDEAPDVLQAELFSETPEDFIQNDEEHDDSEDDFLEPEEVIVINVMAKQGESFAGSDLLPILMQHGMRLGKMSIFHQHADNSDNGPVVFSMANMVKPGTFDITQMDEFSTPGVSFFLQLPNAFGNMKSFEHMLSAADSIKENLNGDLKDEHRSVITRQTIEHCRQRIQDFELAQLSKK